MQDKPGSHYIVFSKKERRAVLIWTALILLLKTAAHFYEEYQVKNLDNEREWIKLLAIIDTLETRPSYKNYDDEDSQYYSQKYPGSRYKKREFELFAFDPNTAGPVEWRRLGVNEKTIRGIEKYISKGGRFRKAEDLKKIWGIREDHALTLIPYVRINESFKSGHAPYEKPSFRTKIPVSIDINHSDSAEWEMLPGIGSKLAGRIIKFRDRLGGFYSVQQVSETFGLSDTNFLKIKPLLKIANAGIKKINLNAADLDQLKSHPYIRYQLANVIIRYRLQHGPFKSIEELKRIMIITEEQFQKMKPYIDVN